jgi:hypothetical protein
MATVPFVHRSRYGSFDSICTKCYKTIANEDVESDLAQLESSHQCSGLDLAYLVHPEAVRPTSPKRRLLDGTMPFTRKPSASHR